MFLGGLTGRITPVETFPMEVLALEYLYGILCPIPNFPPRAHTLQSFDLVRVTYGKNYLMTQSEFIYNVTGNKQVTFVVSMAFDKEYKLCRYDGKIFCNGSLQQ
jgi:hypothetical protein